MAEDKTRSLSRVVRKYKMLVVIIQETKKEVLSETLVNFFLGSGGRGCVELPSQGVVGGVVVIWDSSRVNAIDFHIGKYLILILCKLIGLSLEWIFTKVYGLVVREDKLEFLEELDNIGRVWSYPWLLAGDFNVVKQPLERNISKASISEKEIPSVYR